MHLTHSLCPVKVSTQKNVGWLASHLELFIVLVDSSVICNYHHSAYNSTGSSVGLTATELNIDSVKIGLSEMSTMEPIS